jgi:plastocyanin
MGALVRRASFLSALALLATGGMNGASAAGHAVVIVGTPQSASFSPASLTIALNDTVTWSNDSPTIHYVVFAGAAPAAVQNNTPYTKAFTSAGTFSYYCSKHPSMTGRVVVLGPPPTPAPTAPPTRAPTAPPTPAPTVAPPPPPPAPTVAPPPPTAAPVIATPPPPPPATLAPPTPAPTAEATPEPVALAVTSTGTPDPTLVPPTLAPAETAAVVAALTAERPAMAADDAAQPVVWWPVLTAMATLAIGLPFWLFFLGPLRLRRYWFEFDVDSSFATSGLRARLADGCGVTGRDEDDCLELIKQDVIAGNELPKVKRVVRDIDLSTLSAMIRRTMRGARHRGVWYPTSSG